MIYIIIFIIISLIIFIFCSFRLASIADQMMENGEISSDEKTI